jgi:hypothetical protein
MAAAEDTTNTGDYVFKDEDFTQIPQGDSIYDASISEEIDIKKIKMNQCTHIISHGSLPEEEDLFTIPDNITLIQYTIPEKPIYVFEAYLLYKIGCTVLNNQIYFVDKFDGEIYQSKLLTTITHTR